MIEDAAGRVLVLNGGTSSGGLSAILLGGMNPSPLSPLSAVLLSVLLISVRASPCQLSAVSCLSQHILNRFRGTVFVSCWPHSAAFSGEELPACATGISLDIEACINQWDVSNVIGMATEHAAESFGLQLGTPCSNSRILYLGPMQTQTFCVPRGSKD